MDSPDKVAPPSPGPCPPDSVPCDVTWPQAQPAHSQALGQAAVSAGAGSWGRSLVPAKVKCLVLLGGMGPDSRQHL